MSNLTQAEEQKLHRIDVALEYIGGCALAALCLCGVIHHVQWMLERV